MEKPQVYEQFEAKDYSSTVSVIVQDLRLAQETLL